MTTAADDIEGADAFGTASLDREYDGYKVFKLKVPDAKKQEDSTEFICRFLPPMKSLKDQSNAWKMFYGNHYGHYGNGKSADKPRSRPFGCIERKDRNREIIVHCPKCDQMEVTRSKQKARESELKAANPSVADNERAMKDICRADSAYAAYNEWLKKHNCDKKWYINVMAQDGSFGVLMVTYTTMKDVIEPKLKTWRDGKKIDVFHPFKGVWLKFTRTGVAPRVTDSVELLMEEVDFNGEKLERPKVSVLTKEQIARALKICPDLAKDVVKFLPVDKMTALVESKGDLDKVDEIWDGPKKDKVAAGGSLEDGLEGASTDPELDALDKVMSLETSPTAITSTNAGTNVQAVDAEEAALEAQMKALKERKAKKSATPSESAEDFLSAFGAK